jgi:glucuronate isomerase
MDTGVQPATFLDEDFLLQNRFAKSLYHDYAADLPVIDYHNHLPPADIANDKNFENISSIWLHGDHYKWRAMRAYGVDEKFITGAANDREKFMKWAEVVPYTIGNPLFHWTQMELLKPFGINEYLNPKSAETIYEQTTEMLQQPEFSTVALLRRSNVMMVGTTDDPLDDLHWHKKIAENDPGFKVLPSFRPDKILNISNRDGFVKYVDALATASGITITDIESLVAALRNRIEYFHAMGCRVADHGLVQLPLLNGATKAMTYELTPFLKKANANFSEPEAFAGYVLLELCKLYHEKGWVMQFHLGALRNNNTRMLDSLGADTGYDSIGDYTHGERLSAFLNNLESTDQLAKTILYNLNPADNEMFAAMTGNFNSGGIRGKIQYGSAWWFLDQKDGIEKQLNTLANFSLLSTFIGMTTDSRSFLSYSRHEYFRRILCNMLGKGMANGELPTDEKWIGGIVKGICFENAKEFFEI